MCAKVSVFVRFRLTSGIQWPFKTSDFVKDILQKSLFRAICIWYLVKTPSGTLLGRAEPSNETRRSVPRGVHELGFSSSWSSQACPGAIWAAGPLSNELPSVFLSILYGNLEQLLTELEPSADCFYCENKQYHEGSSATANLQRIWPLTLCDVPQRAIQPTLGMPRAIEKCLLSRVINSMCYWLFWLVNCWYEISINTP